MVFEEKKVKKPRSYNFFFIADEYKNTFFHAPFFPHYYPAKNTINYLLKTQIVRGQQYFVFNIAIYSYIFARDVKNIGEKFISYLMSF